MNTTDQVYAPIPNEQKLITAMRKAWHSVSGTASYRQGIAVKIIIINSTKARRIEVQPTALLEFESDASQA